MLHIKGTNPQLIVDTPDASTEPRIRLYRNGSPVGQIAGSSGVTQVLTEGAFQILTNGGTNAVYVDASQRVGIGTTSPQHLLDCASIGRFTGNANSAASGTGIEIGYDGTNGFIQTYNRGTSNYLPTAVDGSDVRLRIAGSEKARLDNSGRLLVGTSSTSANTRMVLQGNSGGGGGAANLHFSFDGTTPADGDGLGFLVFGDNTQSNGAWINAARDGGTWSGSSKPTRLVFSTTADGASSPTERARITNLGAFKATTTGSVISTTSSSHEFNNANTSEEYAMRIRQSAATSNVYPLLVEISAQAPNDATSVFINCGDSAATRLALRSNGGLANYQANNVNLSDINTKKDISPAADTWNCLKEWEIVNYRYKDQPDDADLNLGVIAQQVAESCPEVITIFQEAKQATETEPAKEERLGVKEQQMYWMAIKALQEAQARIEQLEVKVAALESA
jgi:hypothetical protein